MTKDKNKYIKYFESKIKESNIDNENNQSLNLKHVVVHAKCSFNNTLFTVTDLSGNGDGIINGASWDNYGAPIGPTGGENNEPNINGRISGIISTSFDNALLEGAHIIAISEDNSFSAEAYSDINGAYSLDLVGSLNYFVNISYEGLVDHNEYLYVAPFEETNLNASLNVLEDAVVEGTVTDWYTNTPLASASVLLAYTDEEMETIESMTDENGYFMVQVPGEKDYDLFVYADGYWVEHDAFFLSSGSLGGKEAAW